MRMSPLAAVIRVVAQLLASGFVTVLLVAGVGMVVTHATLLLLGHVAAPLPTRPPQVYSEQQLLSRLRLSSTFSPLSASKDASTRRH
jgi:hypothetical protein